MKTLLITWLVTFSLYLLTSMVRAESLAPADHMHVWTGFAPGEVCILIQDSVDDSDARAELWLVSLDQVEWIEDVEGIACIDVEAEGETELHAVTYDPGITITVVESTDSNTLLTKI